VISRLTSQKGTDLLAEVADQIAAEGACLIVFGTGDPDFEELLRRKAAANPDRIAVKIGFDNALAHRMEAGSDMILMPSRYEPCGLSQIYSLRYGTVPVVRATGGLDDTIEESTGFKFSEYAGQALLEAVRRAVGVYSDAETWREMMRRGMRKDFSWKVSAGAYSALYRKLLGRE
jgi:starch synthase